MINRSKKQVNFEQEFEYSPIPSNENTTPVNYVPSFINRAADLTGKGFVKTKTEEAVSFTSYIIFKYNSLIF